MNGYLQWKTIQNLHFKSLHTQDIELIGFRDSCLLAQGYSMEGGYQTQYKTVGKSNTHFWGEVSRFTGIFGLHGEKN